MKRYLVLCLAFLLLLGGCSAENPEPAETTESPSEPSVEIQSWDESRFLDLAITYGTDGVKMYFADAANMKTFYDSCIYGRPGQLTINYVGKEGTSSVLVHYDGERYTVTDEGKEKTYAHLIYDGYETPERNGFDYEECFLLSDDPEMTGKRYFDHLASSVLDPSFPSTRLLLSEGTLLEERTQVFGDIPIAFRNIQSAQWTRGTYTPNYHLKCEEGVLQCYNYEGKLLWEKECAEDAWLSNAGELSDGSVVLDMGTELQCYSSRGKLRWTHTLREDVTYTEEPILQIGKKIFIFGNVDGKCDDIYMCCLSLEGELLKERIAGGGDFDNIRRIEPYEDGIFLCGYTQSRNGDFPFSKDGYGVGFSLVVTEDLELKDIKEVSEIYYGLFCGWHEGKPVYSNDRILADYNGTKDYPRGIFDYKGGYVTVHSHALGDVKFQNPVMSHRSQYTELVFSGYSASGKLLWQNRSEIFVS